MKKETMTESKRKMIEGIAKICHEANRAYCQSIGDDTQKTWSKSPKWQKESAIKGVIYHLEHFNSKPSDSHKSWLKEKEATGWKYGPRKNPTLKLHPCMVPFHKLPLEQRRKDVLFLAIVKAVTSLPDE